MNWSRTGLKPRRLLPGHGEYSVCDLQREETLATIHTDVPIVECDKTESRPNESVRDMWITCPTIETLSKDPSGVRLQESRGLIARIVVIDGGELGHSEGRSTTVNLVPIERLLQRGHQGTYILGHRILARQFSIDLLLRIVLQIPGHNIQGVCRVFGIVAQTQLQ